MLWRWQKKTDLSVICYAEKILRIQTYLLKTSVSLMEAFPFNTNYSNSIAASVSYHFTNISGCAFPAAFRHKSETYLRLFGKQKQNDSFCQRQQPESELMASPIFVPIKERGAWQSQLSACRHKAGALETPEILTFISKSGYPTNGNDSSKWEASLHQRISVPSPTALMLRSAMCIRH